ncbi:DUF3152 domain-containing protein [Streptomyces sp. HUCO-GS316]|uniref:DUF3152 domain-containing protein n=1 Tax=Streptomyces sp. HUCO-GS316 TaxID=2692198 RepID=UPI003FA7B00F
MVQPATRQFDRTRSSGGSAPGGRTRRSRRRARSRRPTARVLWAGTALSAVIVSMAAAVVYWKETRTPASHGTGARDGADGPGKAAGPGKGAGPGTLPSPSDDPGVSAAPTTASTASPIAVPATGPGTFTAARASGKAVGEGKLVRRYKVLVEDGIDIRPESAAAEISAVLADRRGWTRDGINSFQLVRSGSYDFLVKIATPGTVDSICGAAGLRTEGKVNCSVGTDVVVNLKRWVQGSPEFDGPIGEYRALIVNHEVGHRIGHGHATCPGPGRPAPAMMQQIKGLKGCVANAWPYDDNGTYLDGPSAP